MKDDAVAPVIAAMLMLAALATFFAVWNSVAIPSMKAESEVDHLRGVEQSFTRFSADVTNAASQKNEIRLEEPVRLGGGSVMFNSLTSSGTIQVRPEPDWAYRLVIRNGTEDSVTEGRLVTFSYHPVGNFWQEQGYTWHYGLVNVTKYSGGGGIDNAVMSVPLNYPSMEEASCSPSLKKFVNSFVAVDSRPWDNSSANCSSVTISAVTFNPESGQDFSSGNGIGTFALDVSRDESIFGTDGLPAPDAILVQVNRSVPDRFAGALYAAYNDSFARLERKYSGNLMHEFRTMAEFNETSIRIINGGLPVTIEQQVHQVNVSAY